MSTIEVLLGLLISVGIIIAVVLTQIAYWVRDIHSVVIGTRSTGSTASNYSLAAATETAATTRRS